MKSKSQKVYYSILAICYLEVRAELQRLRRHAFISTPQPDSGEGFPPLAL